MPPSGGITQFKDAIAKQPDFALAYAGLSLCYTRFIFFGPLAPQEYMPNAEAAARKAIELDESLAEAHVLLGMILYQFHFDWAGSEREFRRALELSPSDGEGHLAFSDFLSASGRFEEALAEAQRTRELDPVSDEPKLYVGRAFRAAGHYDRAIAEYQKTLQKNPRLPRANFQLGVALVLKGELSEGIASLEKAVEFSSGNPRFVAYLGYAYAVAGRRSDAQKILSELTALSRKEYASPYGIALIYLGLGNKDAALAWLQ